LPKLDELEVAHQMMGGRLGGRGALTQSINDAYLVLLAGTFQQFCRDLHSEASAALVSAVPSSLGKVLGFSLTSNRRLDRGNAQPASIQQDFELLGVVDLWAALTRLDARNINCKHRLEQLNVWRNAIAHQDFNLSAENLQRVLGTSRTLVWARMWRSDVAVRV